MKHFNKQINYTEICPYYMNNPVGTRCVAMEEPSNRLKLSKLSAKQNIIGDYLYFLGLDNFDRDNLCGIKIIGVKDNIIQLDTDDVILDNNYIITYLLANYTLYYPASKNDYEYNFEGSFARYNNTFVTPTILTIERSTVFIHAKFDLYIKPEAHISYFMRNAIIEINGTPYYARDMSQEGEWYKKSFYFEVNGLQYYNATFKIIFYNGINQTITDMKLKVKIKDLEIFEQHCPDKVEYVKMGTHRYMYRTDISNWTIIGMPKLV